eukprot:scaffold141165_cov30-Tisochrysis_lutea.AAC.5
MVAFSSRSTVAISLFAPLSISQGAQIKLLAYEQLLANYAMWRPRLTMLQVCFPDRARPKLSAHVSAENRAIVARIARAFGEEAIHYIEIGNEIESSEWTVNYRRATPMPALHLINAAGAERRHPVHLCPTFSCHPTVLSGQAGALPSHRPAAQLRHEGRPESASL